MKIGFDVDASLTDMNQYLKIKGQQFFKNRKKIINPFATTLEKMYGATKEEAKKFWNRYYIDYCLNVKFRPHTKEALKTVKEKGHELHIATARYGASRHDAVGKTVQYLLKRKFTKEQIPISSYTFTDDAIENDKRNACVANHFDVVVEDNPGHIKAISNIGIPVIIVSTAENAHLNYDNTFRIAELDELPQAIEQVERYYEEKKQKALNEIETSVKTGLPSIDQPWQKEYITLGIRDYIEMPYCNKFTFWEQRNKWYPDDIAYAYCYGKKLKNKEYKKQALECAKSLVSLGITSGQIITIMSANLIEYKIIDAACNILGITMNVIHPFTKYDEVKKRIENLDKEKNSELLFILDSSYQSLQKEGNVKDLANKFVILNPIDNMTLKGMVEYLIDEKKATLKSNVAREKQKANPIQYGEQILKFKRFMKLGKSIENLEPYFPSTDLDRTTKILYTGGTTSDKPKGVALNDRNYLAMMTSYEKLAQFNRQDVMNTVTPVFHGFGDCNCTDMPVSFGVTVELSPAFNGYNFIRNIKKNKTTRTVHIMCTPSLFIGLKQNKNFKLIKDGHYGYLTTGGAYLSKKMKEELQKVYNHEITIGYGATETVASSIFTFIKDEEEGYIGIPLPGVGVKIVKPNTEQELGYDQWGELCVSGDIVFQHYYNNIIATKNTLKKHSDGKIWYHTSDLCMIKENGHIYYKTRLDDCITYNGYNVYLDDIDRTIEKSELVKSVLTVATDDEKHGKVPISYVVIKEQSDVTKTIEMLEQYLKKSNLPFYSVPKKIEQIEEIPCTVYGKPSRNLLKKELEKRNKVKIYGK